MLARLAQGPAPVTELAAPTGLRLPTVLRHLSVLEEAGLVVSQKDGRVRSCALVPEALAPVRDWLDAAAPALAARGIALAEVRREWDAAVWPHATAGFFKVKTQIPVLIDQLRLG